MFNFIYRVAAAITVDNNGNVSGGSGFFNGNIGDIFTRVANTLIFLTGAIAVIMVIVGGLRYVLSAGNPQQTKEAKDTILFAVIGVVVAVLSYSIVKFVQSRLGV